MVVFYYWSSLIFFFLWIGVLVSLSPGPIENYCHTIFKQLLFLLFSPPTNHGLSTESLIIIISSFMNQFASIWSHPPSVSSLPTTLTQIPHLPSSWVPLRLSTINPECPRVCKHYSNTYSIYLQWKMLCLNDNIYKNNGPFVTVT